MTTPDLATRIAAAKELYAEATPPPWKTDIGASSCPDEDFDLWFARGPMRKLAYADREKVRADANCIAALHNLFPYLVADWERLRDELEAAKNERDKAESDELKMIGERDDMEEIINELCTAAGHTFGIDFEWTSRYGFRNAVEDVEQKTAKARNRITELEAENDWLRQRVAELEKGIRDYIERENAFGERR